MDYVPIFLNFEDISNFFDPLSLVHLNFPTSNQLIHLFMLDVLFTVPKSPYGIAKTDYTFFLEFPEIIS